MTKAYVTVLLLGCVLWCAPASAQTSVPLYARDLMMGFVADDGEEARALHVVQRHHLGGRIERARLTLDSLSRDAERRGLRRWALRLRLARARQLEIEQRLPEALSLLVDVGKQARAAGDTIALATAYLQRELVHEQFGNATMAQAALDVADSLIMLAGLTHLRSTFAVRAASLYRVSGRPAEAAAYARTALAAAEATGRSFDEEDAHFLLYALAEPGDYATKRSHLIRAGAIARDNGNVAGYAYNLASRARVAAEAGEPARALALTDTAMVYLGRVAEEGFSDERYVAALYARRAGLFRSLGRLDSAYVNLARSAALETAYAYALNDEEVMRIEREFEAERNRESVRRQAAVLAVERSRARYLVVAAVVLGVLGVALGIYALRLRRARRRIAREVARQATLRAEMQHRVKNNLQVLISLLEVQGERADDGATEAAFAEMAQRVHGLARVHELLNLHDGDAYVDAREYLDEVVGGYAATFSGERTLSIELDVAGVELPARMLMPLAIILNELITNSVKHAVGAAVPRAVIALTLTADTLQLDYRDNGGAPADGAATVAEGVGLYLVRGMARQLRGQLAYRFTDEGFAVAVHVPAPGPTRRVGGKRSRGGRRASDHREATGSTFKPTGP